MRIELVAPDGRSALVPLAPSAKRVQLLAYLAWLRGEQVSREKLLEDVFGHGLPDEEATPKRLGEAFDSHRKFLRKDLREAITHLNAAAGTELLPVDLDVFSTRQRMWRLASTCRVIDLEAVVSSHQFIEAAHHDGRLANGVPEDVKRACDVLLKAYRGDFLEEMIRDFPADFDPWPSSWVRKPFTLFRDYYLQALWYSAEYELHQGLQLVDAPLEESRGEDASLRHLQREHYGRAAQLYQAYALHSVNHRFDTKLSFASFGQPGRAPGERVIMSERALRRAAQLYGWLGSPYLLDQLYTAYVKQMRRLSSDQWRPSQETLQTIEQARSYTSTAHLLL
ncbi:MAG: hypothetical protein IMW90_10690 [Thermogemmatispora sp.]|uniref:hypothetical protein n=1 Tax=Thermogemmatispora sp. TaxID=1968838 RepID=UPI0019F101B9|nr:hypothetical protein [Thermogemmatispora sp.]MBE3566181.1 hypothetical protein [Thermogemmatispora sp.]